MINRLKLLVAAAITVVAFAAAATSASAAEFSIANGGVVRAVSSGKVTFSAGSTIACNLTLELSLLRGPIAKVEGARFGTVTRVDWANCEGGNVREVLGLPWELVYNSINGTLPSGVTAVNLTVKNAQFLLSTFGGFINCLYAGDVATELGVSLVRGSTDRYTTGSLRTRETPRQRLVSGSCPSEGSMTGTFTLSPTQTLTRI